MFVNPTLQKRLSELVEALDGQFDPTVTSDLSQIGLCRMVWMCTRQKPQVCISRLRCEDYGELNTRLHQRFVSLMQTSSEVAAAVQSMKNESILTDPFVAALAEAQGWSDDWMTVVEPKARGRGAKAVAADLQRDVANNRQLPDMMKAASQAVQVQVVGQVGKAPAVVTGGLQTAPPPPRPLITPMIRPPPFPGHVAAAPVAVRPPTPMNPQPRPPAAVTAGVVSEIIHEVSWTAVFVSGWDVIVFSLCPLLYIMLSWSKNKPSVCVVVCIL